MANHKRTTPKDEWVWRVISKDEKTREFIRSTLADCEKGEAAFHIDGKVVSAFIISDVTAQALKNGREHGYEFIAYRRKSEYQPWREWKEGDTQAPTSVRQFGRSTGMIAEARHPKRRLPT